jgi:hypothetical protein
MLRIINLKGGQDQEQPLSGLNLHITINDQLTAKPLVRVHVSKCLKKLAFFIGKIVDIFIALYDQAAAGPATAHAATKGERGTGLFHNILQKSAFFYFNGDIIV